MKVVLHALWLSALASCYGATPLRASASEAFVYADFDGDHQLDRRAVAYRGGAYRMDDSAEPGFGNPFQPLRLLARDVDHDADLDLILRDDLTRANLTLFLNDGHGHFEPTEASLEADADAEDELHDDSPRLPSCFGAWDGRGGPIDAHLTSGVAACEVTSEPAPPVSLGGSVRQVWQASSGRAPPSLPFSTLV